MVFLWQVVVGWFGLVTRKWSTVLSSVSILQRNWVILITRPRSPPRLPSSTLLWKNKVGLCLTNRIAVQWICNKQNIAQNKWLWKKLSCWRETATLKEGELRALFLAERFLMKTENEGNYYLNFSRNPRPRIDYAPRDVARKKNMYNCVMLTWQWRCTRIFLFVGISLYEEWNARNFERFYKNLRTMAFHPDSIKTIVLNCTFSHEFTCLLWKFFDTPAEI